MIREIILTLDVIGLGMLLGGGAYESVVMNPNYSLDIPKSLNYLRQFMKVKTPANFFRILSPITMISLLVTVIIYWNQTPEFWLFIASSILLIVADSITYGFHYPRNKILFINTISNDTDLLKRISQEWQIGNFIRIILMLIAIIAVLNGIFLAVPIPIK
jgi:uncharacterized membrane protein